MAGHRRTYRRSPSSDTGGFAIKDLLGGIVGAIIGGFYSGGRGAVAGFLLGGLIQGTFALRKRLMALEAVVQELRRRQDAMAPAPKEGQRKPVQPEPAASIVRAQVHPALEAPPQDNIPVDLPGELPPEGAAPRLSPETPDHRIDDKTGQATDQGRVAAVPGPPPLPHAGPKRFAALKDFLLGGNAVVRVGLIVLFFGVAFLLKYAAEHSLIPIEIRLAGTFLFGMVLTGLGWRLRGRRPAYALLLQGGGMGVLYLTLFVSARMYHVVPLGLTLILMVGLVACSGFLAILQEALPLAQFAAVGGFLAPVLTSTGEGNHVMLFSYYALLNGGILGVAWFRSWRSLNLTGFFFTFGIGSLWGAEHYRPELFVTTEPFLVLFFLAYATISVLFASRQPLRLKGYVDGTLVFGLPLVAFGLQHMLVRPYEYGLAISALVLAAFYIFLAWGLWHRAAQGMRMLTEAYLSLGVVFASVAVPLALDGRWTSAAWALEGAALVWVGVRQGRWTARAFGLFLQIAGGFTFLTSFSISAADLPVLNGNCLGGILIALGGFFSSYCLYRRPECLSKWEEWVHPVILAWGLLWWLGTGIGEITRHTADRHTIHGLLLFAGLSAQAFAWLGRRYAWPTVSYPAAALLPAMGLSALVLHEQGIHRHPFGGIGLPVWAVVCAIHFHLLRRMEAGWPARLLRSLHLAGLWFLTALVTWELAWCVDWAIRGPDTWPLAVWGLVPALMATALAGWGERVRWPVVPYRREYCLLGPWGIMVLLWCWTLRTTLVAGDPSPLSYVPVLNPLELAQLLVCLLLARWTWTHQGEPLPLVREFPTHWLPAFPLAAGFLCLNATVARCVHFFGGVSYTSEALFQSILFQAALSVLWGACALGITVWATRARSREAWFVGAGVLGLEVVKLFMVDLSGSGTVSRIVSFLAVGLLMLLIGFFSPLPPQKERTEAPE